MNGARVVSGDVVHLFSQPSSALLFPTSVLRYGTVFPRPAVARSAPHFSCASFRRFYHRFSLLAFLTDSTFSSRYFVRFQSYDLYTMLDFFFWSSGRLVSSAGPRRRFRHPRSRSFLVGFNGLRVSSALPGDVVHLSTFLD